MRSRSVLSAASVPIVDIRTYNDGDPLGRGDANVDVHDRYHSFVLRARLLKYNGTAANHVMLTAATFGSPPLDARTERSPLNLVSTEALTQLDKWLTAIASAADTAMIAPRIGRN